MLGGDGYRRLHVLGGYTCACSNGSGGLAHVMHAFTLSATAGATSTSMNSSSCRSSSTVRFSRLAVSLCIFRMRTDFAPSCRFFTCDLSATFAWRVVGIPKKDPSESSPIAIASFLIRAWQKAILDELPEAPTGQGLKLVSYQQWQSSVLERTTN